MKNETPDCVVVFETGLWKNGLVEFVRVEVPAFAIEVHNSRQARQAAETIARMSFAELAKEHGATFVPAKIKAVDIVTLKAGH